MSVYKIVNKTTAELIYIGQTRNIDIRKQYHYSNSKSKIDSNLYKYICANGGWDNMEFVVLVSDSGLRNRLILENTYQLELRPMFYWICNRIIVPERITGFRSTRIRTGRKNLKAQNVPGKTLEMPELG